jgi:uncharacterized protein
MRAPVTHEATAGRLHDPRPADASVHGPSVRQARRSVGWFVGLCMALAAGSAAASAAIPQLVPFVLALGPAIIVIALARREGDGAVRALAGTLLSRPARARWYLVLIIPIIWALGTVAVGAALGQSEGALFRDLLPSVAIVPLVVLLPAFAEELAWRGFAVPRLTASMSPLRASLLLAVPWTVMHLVLMLPGGMNEGTALWPAALSLVAYSVLLTWIFVGSGGSVLLTGLVHAGLNGVVPLMRGIDADASWAIRAVLAAVIAIAIVALGGFRASVPETEPAGIPSRTSSSRSSAGREDR